MGLALRIFIAIIIATLISKAAIGRTSGFDSLFPKANVIVVGFIRGHHTIRSEAKTQYQFDLVVVQTSPGGRPDEYTLSVMPFDTIRNLDYCFTTPNDTVTLNALPWVIPLRYDTVQLRWVLVNRDKTTGILYLAGGLPNEFCPVRYIELEMDDSLQIVRTEHKYSRSYRVTKSTYWSGNTLRRKTKSRHKRRGSESRYKQKDYNTEGKLTGKFRLRVAHRGRNTVCIKWTFMENGEHVLRRSRRPPKD